jgi:hypothetical protein
MSDFKEALKAKDDALPPPPALTPLQAVDNKKKSIVVLKGPQTMSVCLCESWGWGYWDESLPVMNVCEYSIQFSLRMSA